MSRDREKYLILQEQDGREVYMHGVIEIPEGKSRADVAATYRQVMESSDEWTYDDILDALEKVGFVRLEGVGRFWEDEAL